VVVSEQALETLSRRASGEGAAPKGAAAEDDR
jgi:hypothetical protein